MHDKSHGLRIAVIVNDMAEVNVDAAAAERASAGHIVEMSNGCICCTLRDDLVEAMTSMIAERGSSIDYVVIESSGISEPMPVAQSFMMENLSGVSLSSVARVDAMVTVVNAEQVARDLDSLESLRDRGMQAYEGDVRSIAELVADQIAFASVVVVNKAEMVDSATLKRVVGTVLALNMCGAKVITSSYCDVDVSNVVGTSSFSIGDMARLQTWQNELLAMNDRTAETEEYGISSFVYRRDAPPDATRLAELMREEHAALRGVLRSKGYFWTAQKPQSVFKWSGVGRFLSANVVGVWATGKMPKTEIVFIGIRMDRAAIESLLCSCMKT